MKKLVRLIYASTLSPDITGQTLKDILEVSTANNRRDHITGLLAYNDTYFMQLLDGPQLEVNQLFQRLLNDSRHTDVRLLYYDQLSSAVFYDWSMQLLAIPPFIKAELCRLYRGFTPYKLTGKQAIEVMEMLRDRSATLLR